MKYSRFSGDRSSSGSNSLISCCAPYLVDCDWVVGHRIGDLRAFHYRPIADVNCCDKHRSGDYEGYRNWRRGGIRRGERELSGNFGSRWRRNRNRRRAGARRIGRKLRQTSKPEPRENMIELKQINGLFEERKQHTSNGGTSERAGLNAS
jgi:hypothetical protein